MNNGLIVLGNFNYPSGSAPSNRIHLYCKALKKVKGFPFVINLRSTFITQQPFNFLDRYEGIPFYYSQKTSLRENKLIKRNINKLKGIINSFVIIRRLKKDYDIKVLFFSTSVLDEVIFFLFLKFLKIDIIRECNEAPLFIRNEKKEIWLHNVLLRLKLKLYDGIIVISDNLNKFYSSIFPKERIFQIPILVDMERFSNSLNKRENEKKIITYVGFMGGNKDGLDNLIEAMSIIHKKISNAQLELVGTASKEDLLRLKKKIKTLCLTDFIIFLGSKNAEEIPSILSNSDLLVLARPNNNQAKAGFPTKLGEYLASGKPIVSTKTGEIPKYLIDNKTAYLVEPDNINSFAEKVILALNDKNAAEIGINGYKVADKNFNFNLYGYKILEIIHYKKTKR